MTTMTRRDGMFMALAWALASVAVMCSCNFIRVTGGDQTQGQEITGPSASPSPVTPPCELAKVQAGTEGDARTIAQGGTLNVGVSLLGAQGVELPAECAARYTVAWSGGEPCILSAAGQAGTLTAPASAAIGSVCAFRAAAGALASTVSVQVVSAASPSSSATCSSNRGCELARGGCCP